MFELIERDGLGRIGILNTKHGEVITPALMPVINPNLLLITPKEMQEVFGAQIVITNSYIINKKEVLRKKANRIYRTNKKIPTAMRLLCNDEKC